MNKLEILADFLEVDPIEVSRWDTNFYHGETEYFVLTYEEVYEIAIIDFNDYVDVLMSAIPALKDYFNFEAYQDDHFTDPLEWISLNYLGEILEQNTIYYIFTHNE